MFCIPEKQPETGLTFVCRNGVLRVHLMIRALEYGPRGYLMWYPVKPKPGQS